MPRRDKDEDKEYQRQYYLKRKEELKALRAEKYASDPEYREKQKIRSKRQHWLKRRPEKMQQKEALFSPGIIEDDPLAVLQVKIKDRKDARRGQTVGIPVYPATTAAKIVRRSLQTWRVWEYRGLIPPPTYRNGDLEEGLIRGANGRLYTQDELEAIRQAAPLLVLSNATAEQSPFSKKLHELWGGLTQGVKRVPAKKKAGAR